MNRTGRICVSVMAVAMLTICATVFAGAVHWHIPKDFQEISGDHFIVDLRYNTDDNFLHKNVYAKYGIDRCWLHPETASRLIKLEPKLKKEHLKLVLWDCYRPNVVQKEMWKIVPDDRFVADPKKGSMHNRGLAVDVTLAYESGKLLSMPTGFDDFSDRAASTYKCTPPKKKLCRNRDRLIRLMKSVGLEEIKTEWWHYSPRELDLTRYPIR